MKGIMVQGTASNVGKSLIATALCRMFVRDGCRVAPFKSQNMSNFTCLTKKGGEISQAQALQAEAAKAEPSIWMNPIVLKPRSNLEAEVIMLGKPSGALTDKEYRKVFYEQGLSAIHESLERLRADYDVVILEGAGSPVELNLKEKELVNMKVAELAKVPVLLVADIDRGGVFASIVGTLELLSPPERERVQGIIVNKFCGDPSLFSDGMKWIEEKTGIPVLGLVPVVEHMIEEEDSLSLADWENSRVAAAADSCDKYNQLADQLKEHLDWKLLLDIIERWQES
ncbi:cobyric acid synthase [Virgibacillus ihumii]|uniref:cobyric acid synthase n=1 Tax=Virgibacillus ihumii TaxID=2686091 RepID=UPI00157C3B42|nr:cobyric acid synthase [Virgibacillus ihumii]